MAAWTEEELDTRMARLLQWGVLLAACVMAAGAVVFLIHHGRDVPDYRRFQRAPSPLQSIAGILRQALRSDGSGLIQLAVILIIATPVARVVFAAYAFFHQRDWFYTLVSLAVLSLLVFGLLHAA